MKLRLLAPALLFAVISPLGAAPQFSVLNDGYSTLNLTDGTLAPLDTEILVGNFGSDAASTNFEAIIAGYAVDGFDYTEVTAIRSAFQTYASGGLNSSGVFNFTSFNSYSPGPGTNFANEFVYAFVFAGPTISQPTTQFGVFRSLLQGFPSGVAPDETGTWSWLNSVNEATLEVGVIAGAQVGDYDNDPQEFRLVAVIPEPATLGLFLFGLGALGTGVRRRNPAA
jgi:hypothetical protein